MKKVLLVLLAVLFLFGCSNAGGTAKVTDGETAIITSPDGNYTKQDLFDAFMNTDMSYTLLQHICKQIAAKEGFDVEASVEETVEMYKSMYGESFDLLTESYGGLDGFKEYIRGSVSITRLYDEYLKMNMEKYVEEYKPFKAQIVYFDTMEDVDKFLGTVNSGADFAQTATDMGYLLDATGQVYTDKDSLPYEVKEYINSSSETGLSEPIVTVLSTTDANGTVTETNRYYIVNVLDRDYNNFEDEFINSLRSYVDNAAAMSYYFEKHNLTVHDQRVYDLLSATYEGVK